MAEKKLLQLLDSISIDKNTNLLPTTLKDGVTCLGVEGDVAPLSMTEDATATASDMAAGVTAYINNEKVEGTLETISDYTVSGGDITTTYDENSSRVIVSSTENTRGIFDNITITQKVDQSDIADAVDLTPEKLLEGNTILGIVGTAKSLDITNDATATAEDIVMGKTAYVNEEKIEGTAFEIPEDGIYQEKWNEEITVEDSATGDKTYLKFVGNPTDDNYMLRPNSTVEMITELSTFTDKAGLTADKIIEGNTILGVVGTGTTGVDTSDATATDREIAMGFTAYVNGQKIEGSAFHVDSGETMDYAVNNGITLDDENQRVRLSTRMAMDYLFKANATLVYIPHYDDLAEAISLTPEKILEGNTILGVVGTAKQEEGTKVYSTLEELQAVTGTEGQFAIVNSGETFDGAYKYTNGAWVEMFSSRRYDNTLTPEEYEQAVATATDIQGGGNV